MKYFFICLLFVAACTPPDGETGEVMGYVPVYATSQAATDIGTVQPRPTTHPGKIYAYANYLFQVEQNEGIHIIDNSDPQLAKKVAFLKVPTCSELAIRSNYLYTNSLKDMLVFNLSSAATPQLVHRLANGFPEFNEMYPPLSGVYFECPDPAKGRVIAWEEKMISEPKCRR